jgi:hypothetical protein|tara:strand:- start:2539 stop:2994 length:456 start_codon:yes stop_codon:yes gene_type:complete
MMKKPIRLKSGGFMLSGSDAGDLATLRNAKNIDDGSGNGSSNSGSNGMKNGGRLKSKIKKVSSMLKKASKAHAGQAKTLDALELKKGGRVKKKKSKSRVNEAGNYTKPGLRKRIFNRIKAGGKGGAPGQWSARKAQMMAKAYKAAGGGYRG